MGKKNLKCPYCGEGLKFSEAFQIKTHKEYSCKKCQRVSEITINPEIKKLRIILLITVIAVIEIFSLFLKSYIIGTLIVLALFMAFYWQVPRFIKLLANQTKDSDKKS